MSEKGWREVDCSYLREAICITLGNKSVEPSNNFDVARHCCAGKQYVLHRIPDVSLPTTEPFTVIAAMNGGAIVQPVSSIGRKVVEERVGVLNLGQVCDRWAPIIATAKGV